MAKLFDSALSKKDLKRRVGNMDQIARVMECELKNGHAKGETVFEVMTGSGLEFSVLRDQCLDLFDLRYKGIPYQFTSKAGLLSSKPYSPDSSRFPKYFRGGILYTCGLLNVGTAVEENGVKYGVHGEISHTPASRTNVTTDWVNDDYEIKLEGEMLEASLFGENLNMHRSISTSLGSKSIKIIDTIENQGFERQPFMLMYHFNFGYPFLDEGLRLMLPAISTKCREDGPCCEYIVPYDTFCAPVDGKAEEVFYHHLAANEDGFTQVALYNDKLGLGVSIRYDTRNLPNLIQWKSMRSGDYALGIEPANCYPEGRKKERERGTLKTIEPFETMMFELELTVIDGEREWNRITSAIELLRS